MKKIIVECPICATSKEMDLSSYPLSQKCKVGNTFRVIPNKIFCEHLLSFYVDDVNYSIKQYELVKHDSRRSSSIIVNTNQNSFENIPPLSN